MKRILSLILFWSLVLSTTSFSFASSDNTYESEVTNQSTNLSEYDSLYSEFESFIDSKIYHDYGELSNREYKKIKLEYAEKYALSFVQSQNASNSSLSSASRQINIEITVPYLKEQWVAGALILKVAGYNITGNFLLHSIYDGRTMYLDSDSDVADKITSAKEFKKSLRNFKNSLNAQSGTYYKKMTA